MGIWVIAAGIAPILHIPVGLLLNRVGADTAFIANGHLLMLEMILIADYFSQR